MFLFFNNIDFRINKIFLDARAQSVNFIYGNWCACLRHRQNRLNSDPRLIRSRPRLHRLSTQTLPIFRKGTGALLTFVLRVSFWGRAGSIGK